MPTYYECEQCGLNITLGWIHYYNCDNGYNSRNLLVCNACGTQHAVEIAFKDWGQDYVFEHDVVIRGVKKNHRVPLMRLLRKRFALGLREVKEKIDCLPLILANGIDESDIDYWRSLLQPAHIALDFPIVGKKLKPGQAPANPDRLLAKHAPSFVLRPQNTFEAIQPDVRLCDENKTIVLEKQTCYNCKRTDTLESELSDDTCPHCHRPGLHAKHK